MSYLVEVDGLINAVESAHVVAKHQALTRELQRFDRLNGARLAATRDGFRLARRKVLTAQGDVVAEDHEAWIAAEVKKDGDRPEATARRLQALDYRLSECTMELLYFVADVGPLQDEFLQLEVYVLQERVERRLFGESLWRRLQDAVDVVRDAEDGPPLEPSAQVKLGPIRYQFVRCIDVHAFMADAEALKVAERAAQRRRSLSVTHMTPGLPADGPRVMTVDELDPEGRKWVWPPRRLFDDWSRCSAGQAGQRLSEHWVLQIIDYTSPAGQRDVSVIPVWTHTRPIAKISPTSNVHTLFGKLQSIDARRGADFAWFFYMLHGNLIDAWAGNRILEAAEQGLIVLPEHDYQVLRRWHAQRYGF